MPQNPVIVIPGISATGLRDEYPVNSDRVWTLLTKCYERIALHPDDLRYEQTEPARVVPDEVWALPYRELIEELRHDLADHSDEPVPVYPFPYDWRQPLAETQQQLAWFVDEVINRTLLMRHYHKGRTPWATDPKVDLIGHSMGGLIIAGYLSDLKRDCAVGKVVTLGTPFHGSLEAVLKLATGEGSPGGERSVQRDRELARLTPAIYHLLPSFPGAIIDHSTGSPRSFFSVDAMQDSTWQSIAEAVRLHSVRSFSVSARETEAKRILTALLNQAKAHRRTVSNPRLLEQAGLTADDWLCVIGVDEKTRLHARIGRPSGKTRYDLDSLKKINRWKSDDEKVFTGDGTVPYLGAKPSFLPAEKLVIVSDDDFSWFAELKDRAIELAAGLHGMMPTMNMIQRLAVSHLRGKAYGRISGRPAPDLPAGADWSPPIRALRSRCHTWIETAIRPMIHQVNGDGLSLQSR